MTNELTKGIFSNEIKSSFRINAFIFLLSTICLCTFIIPSAIFPRSIFILILSLIPFFFLLNKKIALRTIIYCLVLLLLNVLLGNWGNLLNIYYLFLYDLIITAKNIDYRIPKNFKIILFCSVISIFFQIFYYQLYDSSNDGRSGLGTDPNFSGIIVLFLFFILKKYNSKIAYLPIILGILFFQSRALLFGLLIFWGTNNLFGDHFKNWIIIKLKPLSLILIANTLVFIMSIFMVNGIKFSANETNTTSVVDRIVNINDQSNAGRLSANVFWLSRVISGDYTLKFENLEEKKYNTDVVIMPHNSLLNLIISSSLIFSIIYLYYFNSLAKYTYTSCNLPYYLSYIFYSLFLHGLFNNIFLFPFLIITALIPRNESYSN